MRSAARRSKARCGLRLRRLPSLRRHRVQCVRRGGMLGAFRAKCCQVVAREQRLARARQHRRRQMKLVDQPRLHVVSNRRPPAARAHARVEPLRCLHAPAQGPRAAVGDEVERRAALHRDRFACVARQHECRHMVGQIDAPPALPGSVGSESSHRFERDAAQNLARPQRIQKMLRSSRSTKRESSALALSRCYL